MDDHRFTSRPFRCAASSEERASAAAWAEFAMIEGIEVRE
jgi:hypothetical protein